MTRKPGRPPLADQVSQLPACTVPARLHDAAVAEATARRVSVAHVVREALVFHLETSAARRTVHTK